MTGNTRPNLPTTPGAFQTTYNGDDTGDAFVSKLRRQRLGPLLLHLPRRKQGGRCLGIAVDGSGNAYVTGITGSSDFPTTPGAFLWPGGGRFVTKLNPAGSALVYPTSSIGGSAIAVDAAGEAYLTGGAACQFPHHPRRLPDHLCGSGCLCQQAERCRFGPALLHLPRRER